MGHPESMSSSGNLFENSGKIGCLGWFRFRPFSTIGPKKWFHVVSVLRPKNEDASVVS